ncbi:MAG: ATP-binding protein [Allomuricauda sp.]
MAFALLLLLWSCNEQSSKEDAVLEQKTETIKKYIDIAKDSTQLSLTERKQFLKLAQELAFSFSNDTLRLDQFSNISLAYKSIGDSVEFRHTNAQLLEMAEESKIHKVSGYSHWDLADFFQNKGILDSSFYHYQKALKNFEFLPVDDTSRSLKARMLYGMGRIQDAYKDYLGAEISITSALKIFNELGDVNRIYNCYNMLGIIASGLDNSEMALEYYQKAGSYIDRLNASDKIRNAEQNQNNIAHEFLKKEDYPNAKEAFSKLLQSKNIKTDNPELYSLALTSYAYSIFKSEKNYAQASELLNKTIKINDSIKYSFDQPRAKQYYAELKATQGDTIRALQYAQESRSLAKATYNNDRLLEVLHLLTKLDTNNAVAYSNEYYDLNETIKIEERTKRDKFARIRLETDEVIQENVLLTRQKQIWLGAALGLILLVAAFLIIVTQRIHNNKLKFKQKQQESNQEIYNLMLSQQGKFREGKQLEQKRISEELHDGILGQMLGIRLILSGLNEKDDETSVEQRADLIEKLREVEEEIRTISHELSDASYQKFYNFIVSLEDLISDISKSSGIACSFTYSPKIDWDHLQGDLKINIYRIVQESLQNCVKHAQCNNIAVSFEVDGDMLGLTISDDGIGFDVNKGKRGIGLRNVTSRVEKINGILKINSTKGEGTTIAINIPNGYVKLNDHLGNVVKHRQTINV